MTYQFDCRATELGVRQLLIDLHAALTDVVTREDVRSSIEIAVAEGLNNVVEHALAPSRDGRIHVQMGADAAQVDLDVPLTELPEGGFDWGMIHALTDRLDYSRINGVNRLKMWFSIDG